MYPYAFDYQIVGASFAIEEKSFLIGDEPGVGKTLEAIIYFDFLLFKDDSQEKVSNSEVLTMGVISSHSLCR